MERLRENTRHNQSRSIGQRRRFERAAAVAGTACSLGGHKLGLSGRVAGLLTLLLVFPVSAAPLLPDEARENRDRALSQLDVAVPVGQSSMAVTASSLKTLSDEALTQLSADWANLTPAERRSLLTEVKLRMARQRDAQTARAPKIVATRRYGRVIRNADGEVVRIETQVVRQVLNPGDQAPAYGAGFDRRQSPVSDSSRSSAANQPPAVEQRPPEQQSEPLVGAPRTVAHPQQN